MLKPKKKVSVGKKVNPEAIQIKAKAIGKMLDGYYPNPPIPLDFKDPFTLLVAVMLSAQATDKSVNLATPALFRVAPHPHALAALPVAQIEFFIRTIGLAPTKARHLHRMAELLIQRHGGNVPETEVELEALPGVGHKTAQVVMAQAFGKPAFPVDTHIHRLAERWGLSTGKNVVITERDLKELFPRKSWGKRHLQMIYYGREYCPARYHDREKCPICHKFDGISG
jgi:endonuclease-3